MAASAVVLRSRVLARSVSAILDGSIGSHTQSRSLLSAASRRTSSVHRSPSVCGGLLSVMPLHSAVASARLRSAIAPESQSWGLVLQESLLALLCWRHRELYAFMTAYFCPTNCEVALGSEASGN